MKTDPVTVTPALSMAQLVEDYIYKYHYKMFPIVEDTDKLVGCVTTKQVKEILREEWGQKTVREITSQCSDENTVGPQVDSMKALSIMSKTGASRLMVTEGNRLVGVIALKDLLKFFALKRELGET